MGYIWIADDGLSMFYRLDKLGKSAREQVYISEAANGAQRLKERVAPEGLAMFREALLAVQKHAFVPRASVCGFLRDDGTAVCKKLEWKANELSLYKVVLLNLGELRRMQVEYQPYLQKYEDIALTHHVLRCGGHTLKCQKFCYCAVVAGEGGCQEQRQKNEAGTGLGDLMPASVYNKLPEEQKKIIKELHTWVQSKERLWKDKVTTNPDIEKKGKAELSAAKQQEKKERIERREKKKVRKKGKEKD